MQLYLVRHGEAYSSEEQFERPLNPRGHKDVEQIANFLKHQNCQIQKIFHSEKLRAIETAQIIANILGLTNHLFLMPSLDPEEEVYRLLGDIHEVTTNTLMVGHLPNLALVSNFLITGNMNKSSISFVPAGAACFEFQDNVWVLKWSVDPASILFQF
ncbi:MAG: phosphohistidine phosphatase SixA [Proteobacteria bacterium]|nr:phosphohistidine phosphatase SixA [Pseudomonadota bacterium]